MIPKILDRSPLKVTFDRYDRTYLREVVRVSCYGSSESDVVHPDFIGNSFGYFFLGASSGRLGLKF